MKNQTVVSAVTLISAEVRKALDIASKYGKELIAKFGALEKITITTQEANEKWAKVNGRLKSYINQLEDFRTGLVKPYNDRVTITNTDFKEITGPLKNARRVIGDAQGRFIDEKRRIEAEEQKKKDAEAQAIRDKAEEKAREEEEKARAYEEAGKRELADKALARAQAQQEKADRTVAQEVVISTKTAGTSVGKKVTCSFENFDKAIIFCLHNKHLSYLVSLDLKKAEGLYGTSKGNIKIEGLKYDVRTKTSQKAE